MHWKLYWANNINAIDQRYESYDTRLRLKIFFYFLSLYSTQILKFDNVLQWNFSGPDNINTIDRGYNTRQKVLTLNWFLVLFFCEEKYTLCFCTLWFQWNFSYRVKLWADIGSKYWVYTIYIVVGVENFTRLYNFVIYDRCWILFWPYILLICFTLIFLLPTPICNFLFFSCMQLFIATIKKSISSKIINFALFGSLNINIKITN